MNVGSAELITIIIFLVGQLVTAVWWASKVNATLEFILKKLEAMEKTNGTYVTVADHAKDIGHLEKSLDAVWNRLDQPHACPNGNKNHG